MWLLSCGWLRPRCWFFVLLLATVGKWTPADETVHGKIDTMIAAQAGGPMSPAADDAEFLRRAFLDLAGRIPNSGEARQFLADAAPDKRTRLIDELLAGPDHPRRMKEAFHVMLMERAGDNPEWDAWLTDAFARNKPWDGMVREMLYPPADDAQRRGAGYFLARRLENYGQQPVDLPGLARDVGRLFLGVDLQCAQCHNHLFVDDYKQWQFQGLFAFVNHLKRRTDTTFPAVAEEVVQKKIEFASVFESEKKMQTGPRLIEGAEFDVPVFKQGEEFLVAPVAAKGIPGVPKFSPLRILSEQLPTANNAAFARNIVNRLWFVMFGRGLVHPLDLHHAGNPASHPEVLDLLATEFVAHHYDIRWLLRELALTQTYQRSSLLPQDAVAALPEKYLVALEKPLSAEQLYASVTRATGQYDVVLQEVAQQWIGEDPKLLDAAADNATLRTSLLEKKIGPARAAFVTAFANPPKEPEIEFSPSVKAALFVMNDGTLLSWLQPNSGNLVDRLDKLSTPDEVAEELYLSVLSRLPSGEEVAAVTEYLAQHGNARPKALGQLAWALIASTEFCVNH